MRKNIYYSIVVIFYDDWKKFKFIDYFTWYKRKHDYHIISIKKKSKKSFVS